MEIKKRKNDYGHEVIDCPFCNDVSYLAKGAKEDEKAKYLYQHITNEAKKEALAVCIGENENLAKHLNFFKQNTVPKIIRVAEKRSFNPGSIKVV